MSGRVVIQGIGGIGGVVAGTLIDAAYLVMKALGVVEAAREAEKIFYSMYVREITPDIVSQHGKCLCDDASSPKRFSQPITSARGNVVIPREPVEPGSAHSFVIDRNRKVRWSRNLEFELRVPPSVRIFHRVRVRKMIVQIARHIPIVRILYKRFFIAAPPWAQCARCPNQFHRAAPAFDFSLGRKYAHW